MRLVDYIGKIYGRLLVIQVGDRVEGRRGKYVYAHCECGNVKDYLVNNLQRGMTKSCGCLRKEVTKDRNSEITYGLSRHPLRGVWRNMIERCYNKDSESFKNYGGRGVGICNEWREDFIQFFNWAISNGWNFGIELDRVNNNGDYCPENCRFVTRMENSRNKRNNIWVEYRGERKILKDWATYFGVSYKALHKKMKYKGFTFLSALKSMRNDLLLEQ